jgi:hypothetical protein
LGQLNQSAIYKRLRSSEEWLRWMADQLRASLGMIRPNGERRVRATDATTICEPGSTGTDWSIHFCINLTNLQCDFFELTDVSGGETWRRYPVKRGDILLGDRGYSNPKGVRHVVEAGGDVLVRLNRNSLPLFDQAEKRIDALKMARKLKPRQDLECAAWVQNGPGQWIQGRLLIVRRSKQATEYARQKLKRRASKQQTIVSEKGFEAAQYFFAWTTLPASWTRPQLLELYRCRWQIELAFKRMKSIMGLGHLPKSDPESCRAWLHGKLLTSLLVERMIGEAKRFSPWDYELDGATQQVA